MGKGSGSKTGTAFGVGFREKVWAPETGLLGSKVRGGVTCGELGPRGGRRVRGGGREAGTGRRVGWPGQGPRPSIGVDEAERVNRELADDVERHDRRRGKEEEDVVGEPDGDAEDVVEVEDVEGEEEEDVDDVGVVEEKEPAGRGEGDEGDERGKDEVQEHIPAEGEPDVGLAVDLPTASRPRPVILGACAGLSPESSKGSGERLEGDLFHNSGGKVSTPRIPGGSGFGGSLVSGRQVRTATAHRLRE